MAAGGLLFDLMFENASPWISAIIGLALILLYYLSYAKKLYSIVVFILISLFFIITSVLWYMEGGLFGGTPVYSITFALAIAILLRGSKRLLTIGALILLLLGLTAAEYINPSLIAGFNHNHVNTIYDLLIVLIINASLVVMILNQHNSEYERATKYFLELQEQKTQIEMARLDRLNLIGEMAASIGHEVRNPLTTVRGFLQLFQRNKAFLDYGDRLKLMIGELDQANAIITEFLSLAKNKAFNLKCDNLNRIIEHLNPLFRADALRLGKNFIVETRSVPDLMLDENEIRQCLVNLVRNGFEATGENGTVLLQTYLDRGEVILAIQDNGSGIPSEIYHQLGTPFITTKPDGNGIGLPICFRIAERHNARIEVETASTGTTFAIRFSQQTEPA